MWILLNGISPFALRFLTFLLSAGCLYPSSVASLPLDPIPLCVAGDRYSAYYDASTNLGTQTIPPPINSYYSAFTKMAKSFDSIEEVPVGLSGDSCQWSTMRKLTLTLPGERRNVSIILIRPTTHKRVGNNIGNFYEVLSFALAHGILVGRLDTLIDVHQLGMIGRLESHLPRLFVPNILSYNMLTMRDCDTVEVWPWERAKSHTWNTTEAMNNISKHMMTSYVQANIPAEVLGLDLSDSVGIHFRCGDNLDHPTYGLIGFKAYANIFDQLREHLDTNINRVIIYTDANRKGVNGRLCSSLVRELCHGINKHWLPGIDVEVHRSPFSHAFAMLHFSGVTVCSISTFCFYSTFGSKLSYQPLGPLLNGYSTINGTDGDPRRKVFWPVLLRPSMFPDLSEIEFINIIVNS